MEKFTRLRDIDNMIKENYDIIKEYSIYARNNAIISETINNNQDTIDSTYHKINNEWRLAKENIRINTDKYRSKGFNYVLNVNYEYKSNNFICRFDKIVTMPFLSGYDITHESYNRYINMINPNQFNLKEFNPLDVYYYYGDKNNIFKDFEEAIGVSIKKTFDPACRIKKINHLNKYIVAKNGEPLMTIDYTDEFDNKRVAKIEIFDEKKIIYFVRKNIMGNFVLDTTIYEYEIDESLPPLINKRVISINDTPVMANYDHYFAPKTFNGQDTYLGEIDHSDGEENFTIKSYLYKACLFENRDLIYYEDNNIYYLDQIVISDYNIEIDHIKRYLLISK